MDSKLNSVVISSILAFALIAAGIPTAFENVLGQEGAITPEGSVNDTMSGENATQWANATLAYAQEGFTTEDLVNETIGLGNDTTTMNATLAYAQEGEMMGMDDDEDMMMTTMSNQSEEMKMNWTGTIDVKSTIGEAFKSKVTVNIIDAINAAQTNVGANSFVKKAELTPAHGYLVYKIMVVDENMKKYKVIVDPGNGQVLMKKEITWDYEREKMKYGDEKGDKYGHGNKVMMKDKKY